MGAKTVWTFKVPGPIRGYRKSVAYSHSPEYRMYKQLVRYEANLAGVPDELDPNGLYRVMTEFYWEKKPRIDVSNAHKAIEDALWRRDRRIYQISSWQYADQGHEAVRVKVEKLL